MADRLHSSYHIHISAKHRLLELKLREVWRYRDLIALFVKRNFVVSYKQTILGPAWIFLTPLFSSLVQAFVFGGIAGIATDGIPMLLFYLFSNAVWGFFATCLTSNANTFTDNAYVFGKVYFPRLTTPISNIFSAVIRFGIQMVLVLAFLAVTGARLPVIPAGSELPWVLVLGLVNTGLAYYLYFSAMQCLSGQTVALLCYIDPLTALVLSALVLHERLLPLQIAGAALILGGACLGELRLRRRGT